MKKWRWTLLGVVLVVVGCGIPWTPGILAQDVIRIGVPGPYSGAAAEKGEHLKYGIQLAAEEINAKGVFWGRRWS